MCSLQDDTLFPIKLQAWEGWIGRRASRNEIDITPHQTKGHVLNGDEAVSKLLGVGTLTIRHHILLIKTSMIKWSKSKSSGGKFWYDHQYGVDSCPKVIREQLIRVASALDVREPDGVIDVLQFDDGTEMSLSSFTKRRIRLYNQTESILRVPWPLPVGGIYQKNGNYESISGSIEVDRWIQSTIHYEPYLATNTWYPNRVKVMVESAVVPEERRQFYLIPIVETGQQGYFASGSQYSEGAVYLETLAGERIGRGFLESTAYADVRKQA